MEPRQSELGMRSKHASTGEQQLSAPGRSRSNMLDFRDINSERRCLKDLDQYAKRSGMSQFR